MTADEIAAFRRLVAPRRGVLRARRQSDRGAYDGATFDVTDEHLHAHFGGSMTLGFVCADNGRARFLALDVDERFGEKLPHLAQCLERRRFETAAIATSGSDGGRGKVLVFFARSYAVATLQRLAREIYADARQLGGWSAIEAPSVVSYFPACGEGGLLRIGGRNRKPLRGAIVCDVFMSLDGEPRSFTDVVPVACLRARINEIRPVAPSLTRWARSIVEDGIDKHPGSDVLYQRTLPRLAREYAHVFGATGEAQFIAATEHLWKRSPALHEPSPKNQDPRARVNFERGRAHAWKTALESHEEALLHPGGRCIASLGASARSKALYCFLAAWAERHQLHPDAFGVSSRVVASHLSLTASAGWKRMVRAEREGAIVVHDRGTCGTRGLPMIVGLIGENDSPKDVLRRGSTRPIVLERIAARKKHEATEFNTVPTHAHARARGVFGER
jgi:hypothetical protein